jgi:quinohemoprotein ethanol dehydrogenase
MSFNPNTGLVYIPAIDLPGYYNDKAVDLKSWQATPGFHGSTGLSTSTDAAPSDAGSSSLVAWDPILHEARWVVGLSGYWNGGTLTTAGNLVFQGRSDGVFVAYDAQHGDVVWSLAAGAPITAPPITYQANGKQYITVLTGVSGGGTILPTATLKMGWDFRTYPRRVLTFALDGAEKPPPRPAFVEVKAFEDPLFSPNPVLARRGLEIFADLSCLACHGSAVVSGGAAPDLRTSHVALDRDAFRGVVRDGALSKMGMPQWSDMSDQDLDALREYIRAQAAILRGGQTRVQ